MVLRRGDRERRFASAERACANRARAKARSGGRNEAVHVRAAVRHDEIAHLLDLVAARIDESEALARRLWRSR
jgi:hypothetical protein